MKELRFTDGKTMPAGKIICVGKNYAEHAKEMGSDIPEKPVVFMKPNSSLIGNGHDIILPFASESVHHEVELAVIMGEGGRYLSGREAMQKIVGYAVFLDVTARDIQSEAKKKGLPWTVAKGFDTFAVISDVVPASSVKDPQNLRLTLSVNGDVRQDGWTGDMIFPVSEIISYISSIMTLESGDIIATGTPEGVGEIKPGDILESSLDGLVSMRNRAVKEG